MCEKKKNNVRWTKKVNFNFFFNFLIFIRRRNSIWYVFWKFKTIDFVRDRRIEKDVASSSLSSLSFMNSSKNSSFCFSIEISKCSNCEKIRRRILKTFRKCFEMKRKRTTNLSIRIRFFTSNVIRLKSANCLNLNASLSMFFFLTTTLFWSKTKMNLIFMIMTTTMKFNEIES